MDIIDTSRTPLLVGPRDISLALKIIKIKTSICRKVEPLIYQRDIDKNICTELMASTVNSIALKWTPDPLRPRTRFSLDFQISKNRSETEIAEKRNNLLVGLPFHETRRQKHRQVQKIIHAHDQTKTNYQTDTPSRILNKIMDNENWGLRGSWSLPFERR